MDYSNLTKLVPLTERNGAPRHEDEKLQRLITAAVEQANEKRDSQLLGKLTRLIDRFEHGFERLSDAIEAFVAGEQEVAVANMTDDPLVDDLPHVARVKAEATLIYTLKASDIAQRLGLKASIVPYLLGRQGLNWLETKSELWCDRLHQMTKRRLWHPKTVELLRNVILDDKHPERGNVSDACVRKLNECRSVLKQ